MTVGGFDYVEGEGLEADEAEESRALLPRTLDKVRLGVCGVVCSCVCVGGGGACVCVGGGVRGGRGTGRPLTHSTRCAWVGVVLCGVGCIRLGCIGLLALLERDVV